MFSAKRVCQLLLLFPLVLLSGAAVSDAASDYPSKPVKLVVPYPPGGSADVLARLVGQHLNTALGQPVVVENKPGAGTAIGAKAVAQSASDGYTLLVGTVSSHAMNPALMSNIGYDPVTDFTAISPLATIPFVLLAHPKVAANSLPELVDLAKRQPGKLNFSSAGNGTSNHLAGALLNSVAQIQLAHIPYKGSAPALNGLLGGQVDLMFDLVVTCVPHVKTGAVKPLAITASQRSQLLPDVPTVAEAGMPALELSAWFGLFGPRDLPADVSSRLARELAKIMEKPEFQDRLQALGASTMPLPAAQFPKFVASERDRWAQVIKASGMHTN